MALSDLLEHVTPGRPGGGTVRAVWNGAVLAESDDTIVLEGNHYFPRESVREDHLVASSHTSRCPWKGVASYLTVEANGRRNENAGWIYADPSPAARRIAGRVAFWRGVEIERG